MALINIPLRNFTCKCLLEQPKMDRVIGNGGRGTPHLERSNMICRIFSSEAFKLWDVRRELCQHSRPTSIMVYRVICQPVQIREAEACHEGEQGRSRGSVCCGPTSGITRRRVGVTTRIRSYTRHSEGVRGRTEGGTRIITQRTRRRFGVWTWWRTKSNPTQRSKSSYWKLRMKAKKSLG